MAAKQAAIQKSSNIEKILESKDDVSKKAAEVVSKAVIAATLPKVAPAAPSVKAQIEA